MFGYSLVKTSWLHWLENTNHDLSCKLNDKIGNNLRLASYLTKLGGRRAEKKVIYRIMGWDK